METAKNTGNPSVGFGGALLMAFAPEVFSGFIEVGALLVATGLIAWGFRRYLILFCEWMNKRSMAIYLVFGGILLLVVGSYMLWSGAHALQSRPEREDGQSNEVNQSEAQSLLRSEEPSVEPRITTHPADIPNKLAAIDDVRSRLAEGMEAKEAAAAVYQQRRAEEFSRDFAMEVMAAKKVVLEKFNIISAIANDHKEYPDITALVSDLPDTSQFDHFSNKLSYNYGPDGKVVDREYAFSEAQQYAAWLDSWRVWLVERDSKLVEMRQELSQ